MFETSPKPSPDADGFAAHRFAAFEHQNVIPLGHIVDLEGIVRLADAVGHIRCVQLPDENGIVGGVVLHINTVPSAIHRQVMVGDIDGMAFAADNHGIGMMVYDPTLFLQKYCFLLCFSGSSIRISLPI